MPRRGGGKRRKRRTHVVPAPGAAADKVPRSLVVRRGKLPTAVRELIPDVRRMFLPNTAMNLKEKRFNTIRDYVSVASQLSISHLWAFSATSRAPYLRFAKLPQGPTLTFKVLEYSLAVDVRSAQRRPVTLSDSDFAHPPLLVMNNFTVPKDDKQCVGLIAEMFRRSFPPVDVNTARLRDMRRVVLVERDDEEDVIRIRHFGVRVLAAGLSKSVRKIAVRGKLPKMSNLGDVAELLEDGGAAGVFSSDSEMEEVPNSLTLPQQVKKLRRGANSSVRLVEVGPRLTLELVKAQGGLCAGAVLYHKYISKGAEEIAETERRHKQRDALKRKRRDEQNANVERKRDVKRAKKERYKERLQMKEAVEGAEESESDSGAEPDVEDDVDDPKSRRRSTGSRVRFEDEVREDSDSSDADEEESEGDSAESSGDESP